MINKTNIMYNIYLALPLTCDSLFVLHLRIFLSVVVVLFVCLVVVVLGFLKIFFFRYYWLSDGI